MTGPTRVVVASGNAHKVEEIARIIDAATLGAVLVPMVALGVPAPVEDGATFEENALIKARACVAATGLAAIADDSGIAVEVLDGAPGIRSARFAGDDADDAANNRQLLARLRAVGAVLPDARRATFVCAAALVMPDGEESVAIGSMAGTLIDAPRGAGGFGYDPLFVADATPDGRTNAELSADEKDAISHRAAAFAGLRALLADRLGRLGQAG